MDNLTRKTADYYQNVRHEMFKYIPKDAKRILEIGCGEGNFGVCLKKDIGAEVWGVEYQSAHADLAEKQLDKVFCGDISQIIDQLPSNYFDVVVCNDVLEHLTDPYTVLEKLKSKLSHEGIVVSSLPNIRYFRSFFKILFGKNWDYTESGTMDYTHFRFFTVNSIRKMYENLDYDVLLHEGINATKSLRPWPLILLSFGYFGDIKYLQYATVAKPLRNATEEK